MSTLVTSFWYGPAEAGLPVRVGGPATPRQLRKIRAAAVRVSRLLVAGFRGDDLAHLRYFAQLARLRAPRNGRRGLRLLRAIEARARTVFGGPLAGPDQIG